MWTTPRIRRRRHAPPGASPWAATGAPSSAVDADPTAGCPVARLSPVVRHGDHSTATLGSSWTRRLTGSSNGSWASARSSGVARDSCGGGLSSAGQAQLGQQDDELELDPQQGRWSSSSYSTWWWSTTLSSLVVVVSRRRRRRRLRARARARARRSRAGRRRTRRRLRRAHHVAELVDARARLVEVAVVQERLEVAGRGGVVGGLHEPFGVVDHLLRSEPDEAIEGVRVLVEHARQVLWIGHLGECGAERGVEFAEGLRVASGRDGGGLRRSGDRSTPTPTRRHWASPPGRRSPRRTRA